LLLHFSLAYGTHGFPLRALVGERITSGLLLNGNYGVTMFFVVSGYLICSMSISRWKSLSTIQVSRFYQYRFGRIIPCLVLAVSIIAATGLRGVPFFADALRGHPMPLSSFGLATLSIFTFWHNVLMQSWGWFNYCLNVYWSLSVEEVFYLLLPLVCLLLRRNWLIMLLCLALIVLGPLYRAAHSKDELFFECGYWACFDAIAMGCLVALARDSWRPPPRYVGYLRLYCGLAVAATFLMGIDGHEAMGFTVVAACTACYIWASSGSGALPRTNPIFRPISWLGKRSYEVYLFHIIVLALMRNVLNHKQLGPTTWSIWFLVFVGTSAGISAVVARYISEPANTAIRQWRLDASTKAATANVS
jgi:peptidoglycan/LPS O-acetylase OafA/YrhL